MDVPLFAPKDIIRQALISLKVNEQLHLSISQRTTATRQIEDLRLFHGRDYRIRADKPSNEIIVTRLR